jgi:uncharacterized protein
VRIGLISDTHGRLRRQVFDVFAGVDLILHAGDVGGSDILDELETIAPVHAVIGNTDPPGLGARAQDVVELELAGRRLVMLHGHSLGAPSPDMLHATHPDADIIIYGHTHRQRVDVLDGCLIINPGAAGAARFRLEPSVAILTLEQDAAPVVEHVTLG